MAGAYRRKVITLPVPASLPEAARLAARQGGPLVLLVSLPGCPYCELVRRNYLLPARNESGLQAWQLNVNDNSTPLTGFDGKATTAAAWTKTWKASFTPTVLFLGPARARRWPSPWWAWRPGFLRGLPRRAAGDGAHGVFRAALGAC
jgi:hypothetical protein